MLDVFGFPTPQGANYQEFYGGGTVRDWVKPRGASMVRMLLIGAGGGGANGGNNSGGGSGAITQWIGPAIFIPDVLRIFVGDGGAAGAASTVATSGSNGNPTSIVYHAKDVNGYTLLTANAGGGGTGSAGPGGTIFGNNYFGAAGIFKSIAGQAGAVAGAGISASTSTFLSGGAAGGNGSGIAGGNVVCNYGYPTINGGAGTTGGKGGDGFFITQPIMLGVGGAGGGGSSTASGGNGGNGGIGCGGGGGGIRTSGNHGAGGRGGDGAVFIWSW